MVLVAALRDAFDTLQRNPVLILAATVYALVQAPGMVLQVSGNPILQFVSSAYSLLLVFVMPLFVGGLFAMAHEGLTGPTSLARLWTAGKTYYLRLFVVFLLLMVVYFVVGAGVGFLAFGLILGGVIGNGAGLGGVSLAVLAIVAVVGLLFALVLLVIGFVVQFYAQAVVVDDQGVLDSFKRSYRVVRENLVSVLGFDLLGLVLGAVVGLVPIGYLFLLGPGFSSMGTASWALRLGYVLLMAVVSILVTAFGTTFAVAFYVRITQPEGGRPQGAVESGTEQPR